MKKLLTLVVAALMLVSLAVAANAADISVTLNGEALVFEQAPVIVEGRTLVPLRAIFEALGASVEWNGETKTVTSVKDDITVKLTIGSNTLYKNDEAVELDVPAQIVGAGYTMVPARAIAESFGVLVDWDDATKTVILVKEEAVAAAKDPDALVDVSGENYTGAEGIKTGSNNGVVVVDNLDVAGDKVLYFEANVTEKAAWNYFYHPATYTPGQRYLIKFKARAGADVFGNPILSAASVGVNVRTNGKDNGVGNFKLPFEEWKECAVIYTVPADIDVTKGMIFGIYASPVTVDGYDFLVEYSYYLDDILVIPYNGELEDGMLDAALVENYTYSASNTPAKTEPAAKPEEKVETPAQKVQSADGSILVVSGETFTTDMGITGLSNPGPAVANNPDDSADKVLLFKTNVQKKSWNYLWYDKAVWVPGQRYLITFKVRPENDCYENPVIKGNVGINVHTDGKDKGIDNFTIQGGTWTSRAVIYTIPADIDTSKSMKFGIYANPITVDGYETDLAWSFYIDDLKVVPYTGDLEDGKYDAALFA